MHAQAVTLEDLKDVDDEMAKHLEWILDNDVTGVYAYHKASWT
jgi:hypothetical protein